MKPAGNPAPVVAPTIGDQATHDAVMKSILEAPFVWVYPVMFGLPFSTPAREGRVPIAKIDRVSEFAGDALAGWHFPEGAGLAFFDSEEECRAALGERALAEVRS